MVCGEHRVFIAVINAVVALGDTVLAGDKSLIACFCTGFVGFKSTQVVKLLCKILQQGNKNNT